MDVLEPVESLVLAETFEKPSVEEVNVDRQ